VRLVAAAALVVLAATGCGLPDDDAGGEPGPGDGLGTIEAALASVPSNATCIRFTTLTGGRTYQQLFTVTPGQPATLTVTGLPSGQILSITADAFPLACSAVGPTSTATWVSDAVTVTLTPGQTSNTVFVLRPTGRVNGTIGFSFLTTSPGSVDFGSVLVGQSASATISVTNLSAINTGPMTASILGLTPAEFAIGTNTCTSLAAGATCTIQVRYLPTSAVGAQATLHVAALGSMVFVTLTGTGELPPAALAMTPSAANFGAVVVNTTSAPVSFVVTNTGGLASGVPSVVSSNARFTVAMNTCTAALAGGATCGFQVRFSPNALGPATGTLTVSASPGGTLLASLSGTGATPPAITISPTAFNFGSIPATANVSVTFTVQNTGGINAGPLTAALLGPNASEYVISATNCSQALLPPNASCSVVVRPMPRSSGVKMATLVVSGSNVPTVGASITANILP
jgi:hypothetical protein